MHYRRQTREQAALYEISSVLDSSVDLQHAISPILDVLANELDMKRSTVTLLNRLTDEVKIEAAHGLSSKQMVRGRYSPGEGIVGRVIESGEAEIVPDVSDEPDFLDKTRARSVLSGRKNAFICVPIQIEGKVIGTLSIDREHDGEDDFSSDVRFLKIVGSMIAQAVKVRRRVQEEKDRNKVLQNQLENTFHSCKYNRKIKCYA